MATKSAKKPTQQMFVEDGDEVDIDLIEKKQSAKPKPEVDLGSSDHNILILPSNGKLGYPRSVEYRDIMVKDEEILALATAETYARTLNKVLKGILNDCEFFEDLSIYDRDYALIWLWANNYTAKKYINVKCSHCGHEEEKVVDLTKLEIDQIKDNYPDPFTLPLKNASLTSVDIRLNTVGDELMVEEYISKNPKTDYTIGLLSASIILPYHMKFDAKMKWVRDNVSSREMGIIKKFHQYFKFGVQDSINHTCSACGEVTQGRIPFQAEDVLFPTVQTDFEELLQSN